VGQLDGIGAGRAFDRDDEALLLVEHADHLVVEGRIHGPAHILQPHGFAVAVGDDLAVIGRGAGELSLGLDRIELVDTVEGAGGLEHGFVGKGRGHFVHANAECRQLVGIDLDARGVGLVAVDRHLGHAVDHGNTLGDVDLGVVGHAV